MDKYRNATLQTDFIPTMMLVRSGQSEILNQTWNTSFPQTTVSDNAKHYLKDESHLYQSGNNHYSNEYKYSDSKYYDSELCQMKWNCDYTTSWIDPPYLCFCDDLCTIYKDCCQNAKITSDPSLIPMNVSFDCLYIPSINDEWFVYIINSCPQDTDYELYRLCIKPTERNIYSTTPVTSFTTRFLYRNVYCALCNGVTEYVYWKVLLRCVWKAKERSKFISLSIQKLYMRDECYLLYKEPMANSYRKCYPKITTCPESSNESTTRTYKNRNDVTRCEYGGNRYVFTSDAIHKNPACYECNKEIGSNHSDPTCNLWAFENSKLITNTQVYIT